jgi:hypothetical protein
MTVLQILSVRVPPGDVRRTVVLRDDWVDADIRKGKSRLHAFLFTLTYPRGCHQCPRRF